MQRRLDLFLVVLFSASSQYAVQNGEIDLNDAEITLLVNSTYEIIEEFEGNETELAAALLIKGKVDSTNLTEVTVPPTVPQIRQMKSKKPRMKKIKAKSSSINCRQYTEAEKYQLLETAGGRNQLFMADSIDEAGKNFADVYPLPPTAVDESFNDQVRIFATSFIDPDCDVRCRMIKQALNDELANRTVSKKAPMKNYMWMNFNDATNTTIPPPRPSDISSSCFLGNFISVGDCTDMGEDVDGDHYSLCSECHGLYMLGDHCFPKIFNAIQCNSQEMACIFDAFSDKAHGQCHMQTLAFKVLRNVGDAECEDWTVEQIQIPVSCQCTLSKNSFLRSRPKEL